MISQQTTAQAQNSGSTTSPFDQIATLEAAEAARIEKECSAMQKEKDEVMHSVNTKEQQGYDEMKDKAKAELKQYSEQELNSILSTAQSEAEAECNALEQEAGKRKAALVSDLTKKAADPSLLDT